MFDHATAVLPQLRTAWALTTVQASFLTVAVQAGFVVGALVSAFFNLADIIAARTLMLLGALGAAAVNLLLVGAHSAGPAVGLRFLTGAFLAGVYPPGLKAMSTWFRVGRGTALGIMVGALTLGSAAPQFLNGIGGADWRTGYPRGIKITDREMRELERTHIARHDWHGNWNYTLNPATA